MINEKVKPFTYGFLFGIILTITIAIVLPQISSPPGARQDTTVQSTDDGASRELREQLQQSNERLSSALDQLQRYRDYNTKARAILEGQGDSIAKIRAIIESMPE